MDSREFSALDPKARVPNTLTVVQAGEHQIFNLKRHPVGILGVYAVCALISVITAALAFGLAPGILDDSNSGQVVMIGIFVFMVVAVISAVFAAIETKIYWGNSWILTTDSLTQVSQTGLFNRESSQLSLENLEDISSMQDGVFPRMFNYGQLRVETAGEQSKFTFLFCPNPNYYAALIISAREVFEQHGHQEANTPDRAQPVQTGQPAPPVEPPVVQVPQPAPQPLEIDSYEVPDGPEESS